MTSPYLTGYWCSKGGGKRGHWVSHESVKEGENGRKLCPRHNCPVRTRPVYLERKELLVELPRQ